MTLVHTSNNVDLSGVVPLEAETGFAFAQSAEVGSPETVSVLADDPTLAYSFTGLKSWYMTETAIGAGATGRIWSGYIGKKTLSHTGGDVMFPAGRVWQVELHEVNFLLSRVNFAPNHATANRPAETYNARMAWLLSVAPFAAVMIDHGLIQASTVSLDASDYRNRTCDDVLKDLALATNFNYLLRFRAASNDFELICHEFNTSGLDTSTFRISNVAADVDSVTTWAPFFDAQLDIDPSRIADAVTVAYGNGGYVKVSNSATTTAFAPQHQMAPGGPFKTLATATVQANRLLAEMDEEEEAVTVTVRLPAASLNNVLVGQLISAKFSHFPDWTTFRSCRVMRKEFGRPENRTQSYYDVRLKLVPVQCSGAAAAAYRSSTAEIPDATPTLVTLETATVAVGGTWWSAGSPTRLTVPAGTTDRTYLIIGNSWWDDNVTNNVATRVKKNGSYIRGTQNYAFQAMRGRQALGLVRGSAGDYFELEVYQDSGVTITLGAATNESFSSLAVVGLDQGAAAKAYSTGTQSVDSGVDTALTLASAEFEIGGTFFSGGSPTRLTVPAGAPTRAYLVGGHAYYGGGGPNPDVVRNIRIRKNGTTYVRGTTARLAGGTVGSVPTIGLVQLAAGDYIELLAYQTTGGSLTVGNAAAEVNTALWLARIDSTAQKVYYAGAGFSVTQQLWTPAAWTDEEVGGGLWSSGAPTRMTAPGSGAWLVGASSAIGGVQYSDTGLRKNGTGQTLVQGVNEIGQENPIAVGLVSVAGADYLEGMVYHDALGPKDFVTGSDVSNTPVMWAVVLESDCA